MAGDFKIEFIIGKKRHEVAYEEGESILDCAIRNDLNPSYSCMEGVCTACAGLVKEGQVDFPEDTMLDDSEIKAGKILTCQAKPKKGTQKLVIDYDAF